MQEEVWRPADEDFGRAEEHFFLPGMFSTDGNNGAEVVDKVGIGNSVVDANKFYPSFDRLPHTYIVQQQLQWMSTATDSPRRNDWHTFAEQTHDKGLEMHDGLFDVVVTVNGVESRHAYVGLALPPLIVQINSVTPNPIPYGGPTNDPSAVVLVSGKVFVSVAQATAGSLNVGLELWDRDLLFDDQRSGWTHLMLLPAGTRGGGYYTFDATTLFWNQYVPGGSGNTSRLKGNVGHEREDEKESEVFAKITGTSVESNVLSVEIDTIVIIPPN